MQKRKMNPRSLKNLRPPWRKGQPSPNPSGVNRKRPITDEYYVCASGLLPEALRKRFNRRFRMNLLQPGVTWAQAVAFRMCFEALMEGSTRAARELREAMEGKAPQRIEISGPEHRQITIRIIHDRRPYRADFPATERPGTSATVQ